MDCKYCIDDLDFKIKVADIKKKCKYHPKKGLIYPASAIAPKGLCRELFYAAYPGCLAVLYNGLPVRGRPRKKGMQETIASCPALEGVKVTIKSEEILPEPLRILKELMEELCKRFYRAPGLTLRRVIIEIIEVGSNCPKAYKIGSSFKFNINRVDELCPAGFATIYPNLRLLKDTKKQNALSSSIYVHCPDYVGVTYEVIADKRGVVKRDFDSICRNYNSTKLKIKYIWKNKEQEIGLDDILPDGFCVLAFHSIYPYMLTFFTGGWFNWVDYDEHVIVNCPSPEGIAMYVKAPAANPSGDILAEVMKNNCKCCKKYKLKDSFSFNFKGENPLRYKMLYNIIPFLDKLLLEERSLIDFFCSYEGENIQCQANLE